MLLGNEPVNQGISEPRAGVRVYPFLKYIFPSLPSSLCLHAVARRYRTRRESRSFSHQNIQHHVSETPKTVTRGTAGKGEREKGERITSWKHESGACAGSASLHLASLTPSRIFGIFPALASTSQCHVDLVEGGRVGSLLYVLLPLMTRSVLGVNVVIELIYWSCELCRCSWLSNKGWWDGVSVGGGEGTLSSLLKTVLGVGTVKVTILCTAQLCNLTPMIDCGNI